MIVAAGGRLGGVISGKGLTPEVTRTGFDASKYELDRQAPSLPETGF